MKKKLLAPLMAVLVACVVVLSGCGGPSIEELITEDLTTQFDEVKNGGDDFLSGLEEASGDEFEQLGIDPKEYAKTYLEGFDYEIGDVTVDEDKGVATAEVSITCKSMNKIVEDFSTQYQEKVAALDTVPSDDELYKMAGQVMVDVTKATDKQISAAVPVMREPSPVIHDGVYDTGMHKVSIIAKLSKFDQLKTALNDLGVTGMTVTQVMGCGIQKGTSEKYRGVPVDTTLLPKIKVEVIVSKISVDSVVEATKKALYTGHIGDGKIFVYNVTRVVKIRTGEEDFAALQDVE